MRVEKLGEGTPEYTVVGSLHGDEPCGKNAIERFLSEDFDIKKPVKLIIANEEALEKNERFIDADLNRSFPGNPDGENHEERLAAEIMEEIRGTRVLDLHSTRSYPQPFATLSNYNSEIEKLVKSAGVRNAVEFPVNVGSLNENLTGIVVEAGLQGTEQASENAFQVMKNFLASEDVIDAEFQRSNPEVFRHTGTVRGDWEFLAENFEKVEKGEVFARKEGQELKAEKPFYPVLMSTNGYEGMLGHKARKLE